ncbi:MAG: MucR family transcriptional regulator [Rhodospirillales bacterium]|nr:MucR family transcriptional regulator [Rhodospirillales bacterium]
MTEENVESLPRHQDLLRMAADIAAAYVAQNTVANSQIPGIITRVYDTLAGISTGTAEKQQKSGKPAVAIRRSITPDFIVCLEDGRKMKMLKRHLRTAYNLSPEEYRSRWGLPAEYPMVAPNYAKRRSDFAKKIGLGRKTA